MWKWMYSRWKVGSLGNNNENGNEYTIAWQICQTRLFCYDVKFKKLFSLKKDKSEGGLLL